jgi:hypothetical protein
MGGLLCLDVLMSDTKHISMRIGADILAKVDAEAKRMRWSRNAALNTCVEFGVVDLQGERGPAGGKLNGKEKVAEVAAEKAGEIGRENGPAGIQSDGVVGKGGSSRAPDATNGEVTEFVASSELAANLAAGRHKRHHGRQNAEIATGGSAGVAADIIPAGNKPSVRKGASYVNRELLRGDAGSKGAAKQSGGKVEPAWFPNSMCPHKYQNSFACEKAGGGCKR